MKKLDTLIAQSEVKMKAPKSFVSGVMKNIELLEEKKLQKQLYIRALLLGIGLVFLFGSLILAILDIFHTGGFTYLSLGLSNPDLLLQGELLSAVITALPLGSGLIFIAILGICIYLGLSFRKGANEFTHLPHVYG